MELIPLRVFKRDSRMHKIDVRRLFIFLPRKEVFKESLFTSTKTSSYQVR
jgi:hypothetical protein